jgi:hypothetical protein
MTGQGSPYIGDVLDAAFGKAQAVVVLMTPDDIAYLHPTLAGEDDQDTEPHFQARPNVLFEAGMAMGRSPNRTVIVEFGQLRVFSDIHGRHLVRLNNTLRMRQELANRLSNAGCAVNIIGTDWHKAGDLEPPAGTGGSLPLGKKWPKAKSTGVPNIDGRFISSGIRGTGRIEIVNYGPGDVFDLDIEDVEESGIVMREADDLPIPKLPAGKSIRPIAVHQYIGSRSRSYLTLRASAKTEDGSPITKDLFISTGG